MPVKINEIDKAEEVGHLLDHKILKHLNEHPKEAFSALELAEIFGEFKSTVWMRINAMNKKGLIVKRKIGSLIHIHLKCDKTDCRNHTECGVVFDSKYCDYEKWGNDE